MNTNCMNACFVCAQAVHAVNMTHDSAHAQMDVKFRSLVCCGLKYVMKSLAILLGSLYFVVNLHFDLLFYYNF